SLLWPVTGPKPVFGATVWRLVEPAAMGGHTAPYDKMETSRSVRRPESGTWQVAHGVGAMGRRYRDPGHTVGPAAA
ncbi:unnamed protein product, partial [Staurois parvus]